VRARPREYAWTISSSRTYGAGTRPVRFGEALYVVPFTIRVDYLDADTREPYVSVEGVVDAVDGRPALTGVTFDAPGGIHLPSWQREWRWSWLLDQALQSFQQDHRAAVDEYLAHVGRPHDLTDGFLATIAADYLTIGRGYARTIARREHKSERTVRSWIELARARGLLTHPPDAGAVGGRLTARGRRALAEQQSKEGTS
jgi:hypothetical protein